MTNAEKKLTGATLVGHCRGQLFLEQTLPENTNFSVQLPKRNLPSGLLHFTLFDPEERPVAERLIYNTNPDDTLRPQVITDREVYPKRVAGTITLAPPSGLDSLSADLSLGVYNLTDLDAGNNQLTIRNYLMLQSDLRGRINDLGSYFSAEDAKTNTLRDLLLLTHGWRKFDWQDVLTGSFPELSFSAEEHLTVAGTITKEDRDAAVKADVQFSVLSPAYFTALDMTTNDDGLFVFTGFDFLDTVDIVLQASVHNSRRKAKQGDEQFGRTGHRFVDINLFNLNEFPFLPDFTFPAKVNRPQALKRYAFTVANELAASQNDVSFSVDLAEVTVTTGLNRAQIQEKAFKKRYEEKGIFYFGGTPKFQADEAQFDGFRDGHIYELIKLVVPNSYKVQYQGRPALRLGSPINGSIPVIVLDGQIIPPAVVDKINPEDIAVIDVLEGLFSRLYSDTALVIQLVSKKPGEITRPNPGIRTLKFPGFYQARTFYAPDLEAPEADYRTTLYWNPEVRINSRPIELPFTTGDKAGNYLIWIEGLRKDGVPFTQRAMFRVE